MTCSTACQKWTGLVCRDAMVWGNDREIVWDRHASRRVCTATPFTPFNLHSIRICVLILIQLYSYAGCTVRRSATPATFCTQHHGLLVCMARLRPRMHPHVIESLAIRTSHFDFLPSHHHVTEHGRYDSRTPRDPHNELIANLPLTYVAVKALVST